MGTPYAARALATGSLKDPYFVYMVQKDIPMEYGTIALAFDMPGGGVQFLINWTRLEDSLKLPLGSIQKYPGGGIKWLVDHGYLKRLKNIEGMKP